MGYRDKEIVHINKKRYIFTICHYKILPLASQELASFYCASLKQKGSPKNKLIYEN